MRIIWFLVGFIGGLAMIAYREKVQRVTGNFAFAEKYLGNGGTFSFFILLGLGIILLSIFYITGTLDAIINATAGRVFFTGS